MAQAYLEAGAQVAVAARNSEALRKVADELATATGAGVVPIRCDVTQPDQVTSMVDKVIAELGGIDIAVCNAGIVSVAGMLDMAPEEFQRIQNTNVTGVFLTAQAAARAMVEQGRGGVIINTAQIAADDAAIVGISSIEAIVGNGAIPAYCASKAAVIHLTKGMAVELAPHRIRVNSVSPGYIRTELVEPLADYHAQWEPKIPLGRMGRPEELSGLYVYLASEASSYMTGSDIVIDGGYTCP